MHSELEIGWTPNLEQGQALMENQLEPGEVGPSGSGSGSGKHGTGEYIELAER